MNGTAATPANCNNVSSVEPLVCAHCGCQEFIARSSFMTAAQSFENGVVHARREPLHMGAAKIEPITLQELTWALWLPRDSFVRRLAEALCAADRRKAEETGTSKRSARDVGRPHGT